MWICLPLCCALSHTMTVKKCCQCVIGVLRTTLWWPALPTAALTAGNLLCIHLYHLVSHCIAFLLRTSSSTTLWIRPLGLFHLLRLIVAGPSNVFLVVRRSFFLIVCRTVVCVEAFWSCVHTSFSYMYWYYWWWSLYSTFYVCLHSVCGQGEYALPVVLAAAFLLPLISLAEML
jgi:hypothetical protein